MLASVNRPPRLQAGDLVRVVAASGPIPSEAFAAGAARWCERFRLGYDPEVLFAAEGFLAGSDRARLAALIAAIRDPEAKAVVLGRGGYGLLRIVATMSPTLLRDHAKPVIGFSDGTILLALAARSGVAAVHGPVVTSSSVACPTKTARRSLPCWNRPSLRRSARAWASSDRDDDAIPWYIWVLAVLAQCVAFGEPAMKSASKKS